MVKIKQKILSPTAINTYLSCPRKYYLRYIKKLRTKPSIHLIRGQIVHKALHEFHKNHPEVSRSTPIGRIRHDLLKIFKRVWDAAEGRLKYLDLTDEQKEFYHDDSEMMMLNYSHWFLKHDMPVADLTEARIRSENLGLMGIIDAVYENNENVILVDYKTSKRAIVTDDILRQAALYSLLYYDRFKVVPDSVWIHFLKEPGEPMPIGVDEPLLDYAKILIESIRAKTQSDSEIDYPCTCGGYCKGDFVNS